MEVLEESNMDKKRNLYIGVIVIVFMSASIFLVKMDYSIAFKQDLSSVNPPQDSGKMNVQIKSEFNGASFDEFFSELSGVLGEQGTPEQGRFTINQINKNIIIDQNLITQLRKSVPNSISCPQANKPFYLAEKLEIRAMLKTSEWQDLQDLIGKKSKKFQDSPTINPNLTSMFLNSWGTGIPTLETENSNIPSRFVLKNFKIYFSDDPTTQHQGKFPAVRCSAELEINFDEGNRRRSIVGKEKSTQKGVISEKIQGFCGYYKIVSNNYLIYVHFPEITSPSIGSISNNGYYPNLELAFTMATSSDLYNYIRWIQSELGTKACKNL